MASNAILGEFEGMIEENLIWGILNIVPGGKYFKNSVKALKAVRQLLKDKPTTEEWSEKQIDGIIKKIAKDHGIPENFAKKIVKSQLEKLKDNCRTVKLSWDADTDGIKQEAKCELDVCAIVIRDPWWWSWVPLDPKLGKWSVIGGCKYTCSVKKTRKKTAGCCCGTKADMFFKAEGTGWRNRTVVDSHSGHYTVLEPKSLRLEKE